MRKAVRVPVLALRVEAVIGRVGGVHGGDWCCGVPAEDGGALTVVTGGRNGIAACHGGHPAGLPWAYVLPPDGGGSGAIENEATHPGPVSLMRTALAPWRSIIAGWH